MIISIFSIFSLGVLLLFLNYCTGINLNLDKSSLLSSSSTNHNTELFILQQELINEDINNGDLRSPISDEKKEPEEEKQNEDPFIDGDDGTEKEDPEEETTVEEEQQQQEQEADFEKVKESLDEIFSISPLIILSLNNRVEKLHKIIMNLNIDPEPKIINLSKHPNYINIVKYLQNINKSDDEDNIPKVFLSGSPIGSDDEIIEMYENDELVDYLKAKGQGLISI
ncbi:hypothetical protein SBY92_000915 [Candida maltosa Xu316]